MKDIERLIAKLREAATRADYFQTGEQGLLNRAAETLEVVLRRPSEVAVLKLANDAHHRMVAEAELDGGWYGFSHSRDAWENGFETGYWARINETGKA